MNTSIDNTTREERIKKVKNALGISISGSSMPTDETLLLVKEYVDGKKELKQVQKEIVERYKKK